MLFRKQLKMNSDISNPMKMVAIVIVRIHIGNFQISIGVFSSSALLEAINFPLTSCVSFEHLLSSLED